MRCNGIAGGDLPHRHHGLLSAGHLLGSGQRLTARSGLLVQTTFKSLLFVSLHVAVIDETSNYCGTCLEWGERAMRVIS